MKPILITGAAGFIGRHLVLQLHGAGREIAAVDIRQAPGDVESSSRFFVSDFAAPAVLERVAAGEFEVVVHQAAITDTLESDWNRLERINVEGSLTLARACLAGATRLVYASSFSTYGSILIRQPLAEDAIADRARCSGPINLYARSKLSLDDAMAELTSSGLDWIGLRYTNVFGPGEASKGRMASILSQIIAKARSGHVIDLFGDTLLAARDYVPVEHVAELVGYLIDRPDIPSGVYNVGAGFAISFAAALEWCSAFSGEPVTVRLVPNPIAERYQYWTCADMTKLRVAVPSLRVLSADDIRSAAENLYATPGP